MCWHTDANTGQATLPYIAPVWPVNVCIQIPEIAATDEKR